MRWAGALVFVLALVLRLAYVQEHHERLGLDVSKLEQTDNHVFAEWAAVIADGDLLCREQPHAFHHWTEDVAPESRWEEWYGGRHTFHQSPLYPYMVAAVYATLGRDHLSVGRFQALLGALTCWLTFLLGARVASPRVGLIAGLLLALLGPYYFYDAFVLRDGPMAFFVMVVAVALERAVRIDRPAAWALAGAALGLFTLAKETGVALLALTLVGIAVVKRATPRRVAVLGACVLLGWALLTTPAYLRNVAVGAPTFKLSTRGPEVFVTGNARGQDGVGWEPPIEPLRRILMDANFSLTKSMALTLATHRADPWGYVELLWGKTSAFLNSYEVPNNVNYYLHRAHLTTLELGFVSLAFLSPAALLGLLVGLPRRRRLAVPYLLLGALSASVIALYILARFRLQVVPLMAIFAAVAVDWAWRAWTARRTVTLVAGGTVFALLTAWTWSDENPYGERAKHASLMLQLAKIENFDQALRYRDLLVEAIASHPELHDDDDVLAAKLDTIQLAFGEFERSRDLPDGSPEQHVALGSGYAELLSVTKRGDLKDFSRLARRHFQRAIDLDHRVVGARYGQGRVEYELVAHPQNTSPDRNFGPALGGFFRELEVHPEHGPSHWEAGRILLAWENFPQALQHFLEAERAGIVSGELCAGVARASIDPRVRDAEPVLVGGEPVAVFDRARALTYADRAIALDPDNPQVQYFVSMAFFVHGRYEEAIALLEQLVVTQPWRAGELRARIDVYRAQQSKALQRAGESTVEGEFEESEP